MRRGADPIDYSVALKTADFGNLDQALLRAACGNVDRGCGPAAAANSFQFLENTYKDIYGKKLLVNPPDGRDRLLKTGEALSGQNYMKTCCGGPGDGTFRDNFVTGKQKYIEEKVPNATATPGQGGKEVCRVLSQDAASGRLLVHQDGQQLEIQKAPIGAMNRSNGKARGSSKPLRDSRWPRMWPSPRASPRTST